MNKNTLNREVPVLALAFVGDSAYDTYIRAMLLKQGKFKPNLLHRRAQKYNQATAQSLAFIRLLPTLSETEKNIAMRGRNVKVNSVPKSASVTEYKNATGIESLVGYLYLLGDEKRLEELMQSIVEIIEREGEENEG